jgi:transcriptional regulator with XRE-family HTH domain
MKNFKGRYDPCSLGERLKEFLDEYKVAQDDFGELIGGFGKSYISKVIKGKAHLTLVSLDAACEILGTTPVYLMYGTGPKYLGLNPPIVNIRKRYSK